MVGMHLSTRKFRHMKKKVFGRNHTKDYQKPPDMDDVVDQENAEKSVDTYDQFFGTEICLPG